MEAILRYFQNENIKITPVIAKKLQDPTVTSQIAGHLFEMVTAFSILELSGQPIKCSFFENIEFMKDFLRTNDKWPQFDFRRNAELVEVIENATKPVSTVVCVW